MKIYCVLHMTWLSQLLRYVDSLTVQQLYLTHFSIELNHVKCISIFQTHI